MKLWIPPREITCRALALVWRGPELLMIRVNEEHGEIRGYRPIGGGIEFGETSLETVQREVQEELGTPFQPESFLGWVENLYTFNGHPGHEMMALWEGTLADKKFYEQERIEYIEADKIAKQCFMVWRNPFAADLPVWPEKMLEKLKDKTR